MDSKNVLLPVLATLISCLDSSKAYGDCTGHCFCNIDNHQTGEYCSISQTVQGYDINQMMMRCGWADVRAEIDWSTVRCDKLRPESSLKCARRRSDPSPSQNTSWGSRAGSDGNYVVESCIKAPSAGYVAEDLHCRMRDAPKWNRCNFKYETNGWCDYMASQEMNVVRDSRGILKYCWVVHDEGGGRLREFQLGADWKKIPRISSKRK